ncbi:MAG: polysaccharide deacetylase family protein [Solirubrobacteraceae bacterium]
MAPRLLILGALSVVLAGCGSETAQRTDRETATTPPSKQPATRPAEQRPRRAPRPERPVPSAPVRAEAIQEGSGKGRRIALTFDADMTPQMLDDLEEGRVQSWYERRIIRTLRKTRTPATLFLAGLWARTYPRETRALARDGLFEIASHTYDHLAWTSDCYGLPTVEGEEAKRAEVTRTAGLLERLTGRMPRYFRFPGLCHEQADLDLVAGIDEQAVDGIGSGDAFQEDPAAIVSSTLEQVRPGSIVVMHMMGGPNAPATAAALEELIPAVRERGYRFATVTELLEGGARPSDD